MTDELPEVVYEGEFEDHEWRDAVSKKPTERRKADHRLVEKNPQPRMHPYGPNAVREQAPDGRYRYFPTKEAAQVYKSTHELSRTAPRAERAAAEGPTHQVEASKQGLDQEVEKRTGQKSAAAAPKPGA